MGDQFMQVLDNTFSSYQLELTENRDYLNMLLTGHDWPYVIAMLDGLISWGVTTEALTQVSLETIGNICNDNDPSILAPQSDQILNAILYGMRGQEPSNRVRLAATQALLNSLEVTLHNFEDVTKCKEVMGFVYQATQYADENISAVARKCFVKIISKSSNAAEYDEALRKLKIHKLSDMNVVAAQAVRRLLAVTDPFEDPKQGDNLLQSLLETIEHEISQNNFLVVIEWLQCLVDSMRRYYKTMTVQFQLFSGRRVYKDNFKEIIIDITTAALRSISEEAQILAIKLCIVIVEEELKLDQNKKKSIPKLLVNDLVPLLLETLERRSGNVKDVWNPHKPARVCLGLLSQACEDSIFNVVRPYVLQSIKNENNSIWRADWRKRDAAVLAFGSILEGPSPDLLEPLVMDVMPFITELLVDPEAVVIDWDSLTVRSSAAWIVRDSAAWALRRVCEVHPEALFWNQCLRNVVHAMVTALSSEPRVATTVCWAFSWLAEAAFKLSLTSEDDQHTASPASTYDLSPYFDNIVDNLLRVLESGYSWQNLRRAAHSALMEMIRSAPRDCYPSVMRATVVPVKRLNNINISQPLCFWVNETLLEETLSALHCILQKVDLPFQNTIGDRIMPVLLKMYKKIKDGLIHDDNDETCKLYRRALESALLVFEALLNVIGPFISKYSADLIPLLLDCLEDAAETKSFSIAVRILGDLAVQVAPQLVPHLDAVFKTLIDTLGNQDTEKYLILNIISTISNITYYLRDSIAKYRGPVMKTLKNVCQVEDDSDDQEIINFLNILRQRCVEAFTRVIVGAAVQETVDKLHFIIPYMKFIIEFMEQIGARHSSSEELIYWSCLLVTAIATVFYEIPNFDKNPLENFDTVGIQDLLNRGNIGASDNTKQSAAKAIEAMNQMREELKEDDQ